MKKSRTYKFGRSHLTIEFGDITKADTQVIVSSDDFYLSMGGGVSKAILWAGGNTIALDAAKKVPAELGDVVVTTAGRLSAQYVFHGITIGPHRAKIPTEKIIKQITEKCMQLLDTLQLDSIAFPAIGAGAAGFRYEDVAVHMAEVIADDLVKREKTVEVKIYLFDRYGTMESIDYLMFFEEFARRLPDVADRESEPKILPETNKEFTPKEIAETIEEIKSRRLHNLRKLLASLEDQRLKLEEHLIGLLDKEGNEENVGEVRDKLRENEEIRLRYLSELKTLSKMDVADLEANQENLNSKTVFLSSTYKDLLEHRSAVKDQIVRRDMLFRGMEHFGADPNKMPPSAKIVEEVRNADIYIGIFGVRYGSIDEATGLSMTELEFNEAEANEKPMFLYIIHEDAPVKVSDIEPDPEGKNKLDSLKLRILRGHTVYMFHSVEDLARQVYEDLGRLLN